MVRRDDDDDEAIGVEDDGAADRSAAIGDEAVDVAVDEVVVLAAPGAIGPGSRRTPPESTWKWTLPNVMSIPPRRPEKAEREASECGVNSKDPKRIEFPEFGDDGDDAGEVVADMIGTADVVSCTNRFPTDGASC
jgi:hypothetical protein